VILNELRVLNYRSIKSQQTIPLTDGVVLVGPNNAGKSNLLRAIDLFFNTEKSDHYDIATDRPHRGSGRTSLRAIFTLEEEDERLRNDFLGLHEIMGEAVADQSSIPLYLEFSRAGRGSYKLFPNKKANRSRQSEFSRRQIAFVHDVLDSFTVRYVPSAKDWDGFFSQFLRPALGEVIEKAISEQLESVHEALRGISDSLGERLQKTLEANFALNLGLSPELSNTLGSVSIDLMDPTPTSLAGKGQGIQSAFLVAAIGWISERERAAGKTPIWLLEEPEAYTHPSLARAVVQLVDDARTHGPVAFTTHSLGLIPADVTSVRGVEKGNDGTVVRRYADHAEATNSIREALGVKAADYFGFGAGAVLTEGPSDREIIRWYLGLVDGDRFPHVRSAALHDYGGVKQLAGFLVGTLGVLQGDVPLVSVFDGDAAGIKEVRGLASRFDGTGVRWAPNLDYVMLPQGRAIEGVFPDSWIVDMHAQHPEWFIEPPSLDLNDLLVGFRIKDTSKHPSRTWLQSKGENDPFSLFGIEQLVTAIDSALERQHLKLTQAS
jgi:putative ATP-dependent endonuclease of OLD family